MAKINWKGGVGNWTDAMHWHPEVIPTYPDIVTINKGKALITSGVSEIGGLTNSGTLDLETSSVATSSASLSVLGNVNNNGTLDIDKLSGDGGSSLKLLYGSGLGDNGTLNIGNTHLSATTAVQIGGPDAGGFTVGSTGTIDIVGSKAYQASLTCNDLATIDGNVIVGRNAVLTVANRAGGSGEVHIEAGGTFSAGGNPDFGGSTVSVVFGNNGSDTGRLIIQTFDGTVAGFETDGTHSDRIDCPSFGYSASNTWEFTEDANGEQGELLVLDNDGGAFGVTLLGQYLAANQTVTSADSTLFHLASDHTPDHGTLVTTSFR